jgi:hypothetical protein
MEADSLGGVYLLLEGDDIDPLFFPEVTQNLLTFYVFDP